MAEIETKVCKKCGIPKDKNEFSKNHTTKDGLERSCKDCRKKYGENYRKNRKSAAKGQKNPDAQSQRRTARRGRRPNPRRKQRIPAATKIDPAGTDTIFLPVQLIQEIKKSVVKEVISFLEEKYL